ncbi:ABC transporter permease [Streptomyces lonarensis]|uniref:ABC transporter permease n=1 Tax=Streptomyces lonarensis TaxID=700599 RepID=A0A7X6D5Y2_9ACTN|nr:ABC transporter permease [Streptomyces lonarensis]NJQ08799.1 ABC transporter permease [Streptomyces lonarensis]
MTSAAPEPLVPVGPTLAVVVAVLLLVAALVVALGRLAPDGGRGTGRDVLLAGGRAALQLAAVSVVITAVVGSLPYLLAFLALMLLVAVRTAGRRVTDNATWWWAGLPICCGVLPVVGLLLLSGLVPPRGIALVPVVGILLGGSLTATVLAGRRVLDELHRRHGEVEAGLALGLTLREARMEVGRPVASEALLPGLDQTRTVGLVTLPGAFVGMLLAGASVVAAGAVQLFVLVALLAVQAVSVVVVLELLVRGVLHRDGAPAGPAR